jgi:hypothetical protein
MGKNALLSILLLWGKNDLEKKFLVSGSGFLFIDNAKHETWN